MMSRPDCLKALAAHRTNEIVVAFFRPAFEWTAISPSDLNYTSVLVMGQNAAHGLGLALAFPNRRVVVLDGDGCLLMSLGCLTTIANMAPRNFTHLVLNNGEYEMTGGQPLPNSSKIDFPGFARAAGYPVVREFDDLAEFAKAVPFLLTADGPVFANLKVVKGPEPYPEDWSKMLSAERREAFKRALLR